MAPDVAGGVDRAGAGDDLAAGHRTGRELVDDAEREHHARARAADVVELQFDVDRELVVHAHADAEDDRAVAVDGGHLDGLLDAVAHDEELAGASAPFSRTAARSSSTEFTSVPFTAAMTSPSSSTPAAGRVVEDAGDGDLAREVVAELDERRRDRVLLRVDHRGLVLRVAVVVADAGREDRLDRHDRAGAVEPRAEHLEPVRRLPGPAEHRDGEQVELAVGGERLSSGISMSGISSPSCSATPRVS